MVTVTIHEAKTHLSRLIKDAIAGQDVTITQGRSGEELVKLVPVKSGPKKRQLGWLAHENPRGKDIVGPQFWEELSDEDAGLASEIFPKP